MSRLSLVACGDVSIHSFEHKENFLQRLLKSNADKNNIRHIHFEALPNRYELVDIISEEYLFPLSEVTKNFDTCIRLQHHPGVYQSLIGLTVSYAKGTQVSLNTFYNAKPSMVILVSEKFGIREATSFWNLRAGGTYVTWISFLMLESKLDEVVQWLNSEYVDMVLSISSGTDIIFSIFIL